MKYSAVILAFAVTVLASPQQQAADGQAQVISSVVPTVTQIADGQIQGGSATVAPTVTQIADGQIQAGSATVSAVVTQIADGQIQAPSAVTQIADGQIQAPGVSQIGDGQIQVPSASGIPAPPANGTFTSSVPSASAFPGAASFVSWNKELVLAAVGAAAGFALL